MKFKKTKIFLFAILIFLALVLAYIGVQLYLYYDYQHKNLAMVDFCYNNCKSLTNINKYRSQLQKMKEVCKSGDKEVDNCYDTLRGLLLPYLLVYKAYIDKKPIEFVQFDRDTTYKVPLQAVEKSDVLFGYGVGITCNFENLFSEIYHKPSYAFDCGVRKEKSGCTSSHFEDECIVTDDFIVENQTSSNKTHTFGEKLKQLNLENKKVYIKMEIAGGEKAVMPDILKYSDNITAISIGVHLASSKEIIDDIAFFKSLNKDFVLVSRSIIMAHKKLNMPSKLKYVSGYDLSKFISLTYVNKNILDGYYLKLNQTSKTGYKDMIRNKFRNIIYEPYSNISWQVVIGEYLRKIFKISYE